MNGKRKIKYISIVVIRKPIDRLCGNSRHTKKKKQNKTNTQITKHMENFLPYAEEAPCTVIQLRNNICHDSLKTYMKYAGFLAFELM